MLLRLVQGFAVGGEWGGAVLMTVEHSGKGRRGLWSSVAQMGAPSGLLLSTLVFSLASRLPEFASMAWGWRVPFPMTVVLATVGLWIRLGVAETPAFKAAQSELAAKRERGERPRPPIVELLRTQPRQLLLASLIGFGPFAANSVLITFVISYATQVGHSRSTALNGLNDRLSGLSGLSAAGRRAVRPGGPPSGLPRRRGAARPQLFFLSCW